MKIVFRVDASNEIGTGHVMRCSAIIEEAVSRNIECVVVGRMGGFDWLETHLKTIGSGRVEDESNFQITPGKDVLIIDSYDLPITRSFIQAKNWRLVASISDRGTPKYNAELIIHPSIDFFTLEQTKAKLLTGRDYIPLRKSIFKSEPRMQSLVPKIVVFGGGTDKYNFAPFMAKELASKQGFSTIVFFSRSVKEIESLDSRFDVKPFGPALDTELESADLVFTTASTSSLEVIAREIPLGICCVADNQISYYEALTKYEVAAGIGEYLHSRYYHMNWDLINQLMIDVSFRQKLQNKSKGFLDLSGSQRILDEILNCL